MNSGDFEGKALFVTVYDRGSFNALCGFKLPADRIPVNITGDRDAQISYWLRRNGSIEVDMLETMFNKTTIIDIAIMDCVD